MLEALVAYAERVGLSLEPGFCAKSISWLVNLDKYGSVLSVEYANTSTRSARLFSCCPDLHNSQLKAMPVTLRNTTEGRQVRQAAHFLADSCDTIALLAGEEIKTVEKHHTFALLIALASKAIPELSPVHKLLSSKKQMGLLRELLVAQRANPNSKLSFSVNGKPVLESKTWHQWWRAFLPDMFPVASGETQLCLASGKPLVASRTHAKLTTLRTGTKTVGAPLVTFDKSAFQSYGFDHGQNSAVGIHQTTAYRAGLEHLLRFAPVFGGTKVAHWFDTDMPKERNPLRHLLFVQSRGKDGWLEDLDETAVTPAINVLTQDPQDLLGVRCHILGMCGRDGRAQVRFYQAVTVQQAMLASAAWFSDFKIVAPYIEHPTSTTPGQLISSLLRRPEESDGARESATLQSLQVALWQTVLNAQIPFPQSIAERCVRAVRYSAQNRDFGVAVSRHTKNSSREREVLHARVGALKSFLRRSGDLQLKERLEPKHPSPNYQSGRLAAVLERIAEIASLGQIRNTAHHDFGNTIRGSIEFLDRRTQTVQRDLQKISMRHDWLRVAW